VHLPQYNFLLTFCSGYGWVEHVHKTAKPPWLQIKQLVLSSDTLQQELGDVQELFWLGDDLSLPCCSVTSKVTVQFGPQAVSDDVQFICRYSALLQSNFDIENLFIGCAMTNLHSPS
jgi:hypothetical protein